MTTVTYVLARDFLALRARGFAAKHAVGAVSIFHGVSHERVLCSYELYELERQHVAFDDPQCPADAVPRASIEMRAIAYWF